VISAGSNEILSFIIWDPDLTVFYLLFFFKEREIVTYIKPAESKKKKNCSQAHDIKPECVMKR
jgi:hypothetical protein